eukprot:5557234-Ditylum_brightwellii.AAC.1
MYPLPLIQEVIQRRVGHKYFTKIDLSMVYYIIEVDKTSNELCTIITLYGKFQYCHMAMGLKVVPDVAQAIINEILHDLDVERYINDIGIFTNGTYEEHMELVAKVLKRLEGNGCKVNPLKCEWAVKETEFLGHWLTPEGVHPLKKKVEAVLRMGTPTNMTELRAFIGAVTYYHNMWPRRLHILEPLTKLTRKGTFEWTSLHQKAFDETKTVMVFNAIITYPNHNLLFQVYTDAFDYQMGAVIMQNGKVVAYWSRKLSEAQRNYTTVEKELLSIVMCVKKF